MDGDLLYCNDVCGVFVGPKMEKLFKDPDFKSKLNSTERRAWNAFENI